MIFEHLSTLNTYLISFSLSISLFFGFGSSTANFLYIVSASSLSLNLFFYFSLFTISLFFSSSLSSPPIILVTGDATCCRGFNLLFLSHDLSITYVTPLYSISISIKGPKIFFLNIYIKG